MLFVNGKYKVSPEYLQGDKSITHRALVLACLANGTSTIRNALVCNDTRATVSCLETLGAQIVINKNVITVTPWKEPKSNVVLNAENSGTTARLLAGLLAGLGIEATVTGDASLLARPMERVLAPLEKMGARFIRGDGTFLYKSCKGALHGEKIAQDVVSAQVKSAVLLAGLFATTNGETVYIENTVTRRHTEKMLEQTGADVTTNANSVTVKPSRINAFEIDVPNDFSSASYLVALAVAKGENVTVPNVVVDEERTGFLRILQKAGANVSIVNKRSGFGCIVGDIVVKSGSLTPLFATEGEIASSIDEVVALSAVALTVKGRHVFSSVKELAVKESNRIDAIISMAQSVGQKAFFDGNLTIVSDGNLTRMPTFEPSNDHRVVMANVVLALLCGGGTVCGENVEISFPNFFKAMGIDFESYAVIGTDVSRSLSPKLITSFAKSVGISLQYNAVNLPADVSDEKLFATIQQFDGVNVTMPFKERVSKLFYSHELSVNTVGKDFVVSTDGEGIVKALENNGIDLTGKSVWFVGAGGVSVAVAKAICDKTHKVKVLNRTETRAQQLENQFGFVGDDNPDGIFVLVPTCEFEQNMTLPKSVEFVFNANYLGKSGLACQAKESGIKVIDGREMLYYQGKKSFELWTGKTPTYTVKEFVER